MNWLKKHLSISQSLIFFFRTIWRKRTFENNLPKQKKKIFVQRTQAKIRIFVSSDVLNSKSELETWLKQYCFSRRIFWWNFQKDSFFSAQSFAKKISPQKMLQTLSGLFSLSENMLSTCLFCKNYLLAQTSSRIKQEESFNSDAWSGRSSSNEYTESMDSNV